MKKIVLRSRLKRALKKLKLHLAIVVMETLILELRAANG